MKEAKLMAEGGVGNQQISTRFERSFVYILGPARHLVHGTV